MSTYTLSDNSYITISIDNDSQELIIEDIKSYTKGNGSTLVDWAIDLYRSEYEDKGYSMTLYAYPQDDTIDDDGLVAFWESQGFSIDNANNAGTGTAMIW
jgi:hypothetical protein